MRERAAEAAIVMEDTIVSYVSCDCVNDLWVILQIMFCTLKQPLQSVVDNARAAWDATKQSDQTAQSAVDEFIVSSNTSATSTTVRIILN